MGYFGQIYAQTKHGEHYDACQDLAWFNPVLSGNGWAGFAAADGATTGADSQLWAELVVGVVERCLADLLVLPLEQWVRNRLAAELEAERLIWQQLHVLGSDGTSAMDKMWQDKLKNVGGACTLAAGVVSPTRFRGITVGDTAVFVVRPPGFDLIGVAGPQSAAEFGSSPELIRSVDSGPEPLLLAARVVDLPLQRHDIVLVCTDALAEWAMRCHEASLPVWQVLAGLNHDDFAWLVGELNVHGEIETDDTLLVRLAPGEVQ